MQAPIGAADGPLTTRFSTYRDPLVDASTHAVEPAGFELTDDFNGAQQQGFGQSQYTIRGGRRCSCAVAYLYPALRRRNLRVETHALATRVLFAGNRATGIEILDKAGTGVSCMPTGRLFWPAASSTRRNC